MTLVLIKSESYTFENGKLLYHSANGKHVDTKKCKKIVGQFRLYAEHFNCALPYTKYYVADTNTGIVYVSEEQHWSCWNELVEQVKGM